MNKDFLPKLIGKVGSCLAYGKPIPRFDYRDGLTNALTIIRPSESISN